MQVGAIIPVHTFLHQVEYSVDWCIENYPKLFDSFQIVVVSDVMFPATSKLFQNLDGKKGVRTIKSGKKDSLKSSIITGLDALSDVDVIHIIEADAIPKFSTLAAMLEVYENAPNPAGICPIFSWNNQTCYPTHRHWFKDPLFEKSFGRAGEVREVGKPGIPFLFSLWNPNALKVMKSKENELPEVYSLDGKMGRILHEKYRFYRVMNHYIEHIGGGKNK